MATQQEVADFLGLKSDRQIRNLQSQGFMHKGAGKAGMDLKRAVQEYITYIKAGRNSSDDDQFDDPEQGNSELDQERKSLQNELLKEKLKLMRQENAPIWLLTEALGKVIEQIPPALDSALMKVKLAVPDLPERSMDLLKGEFVDLKNSLAKIEIDLSDYDQLDDDDQGDDDE